LPPLLFSASLHVTVRGLTRKDDIDADPELQCESAG
jgi:hypothetical protein